MRPRATTVANNNDKSKNNIRVSAVTGRRKKKLKRNMTSLEFCMKVPNGFLEKVDLAQLFVPKKAVFHSFLIFRLDLILPALTKCLL